MFAAKSCLAAYQLVENELVTDICARKFDAARTQCQFQADVAHDCGHDLVARQFAARFQVGGKYPHGRVTINKVAAGVDKQRPVRVPIERYAQIRVFRQDAALQAFDM